MFTCLTIPSDFTGPHQQVTPGSARLLPDGARMGLAHLRVTDLERALAFYSEGMGLHPVRQEGSTVITGRAQIRSAHEMGVSSIRLSIYP